MGPPKLVHQARAGRASGRIGQGPQACRFAVGRRKRITVNLNPIGPRSRAAGGEQPQILERLQARVIECSRVFRVEVNLAEKPLRK